MAEIVTVQLGSYSNYVGSHYWNIQDEAILCADLQDWGSVAGTVQSEVVCAWSEDRYGDTSYRPRTVVLDLGGSLGGVSFSRVEGNTDARAAAAASQASLWASGIQLQQAPTITKSRYRQQLEDAGSIDADDTEQQELQQQALEVAAAELHGLQHTQRYWTDFLQVDLADSCVLTLAGAWQGQLGWDGWGVAASSSSTTRELVEGGVDRVRWWAEQCDRLQGLQVFADDLEGWGGISQELLVQLRDQYPSQPLLYLSVRQQQDQQASSSPGTTPSPAAIRRFLSHSLSLGEVPQLASLYVPLDAGSHAATAAAVSSSKFCTGAVLAAAIDTITLPLRCTGAASVVGPALGATDLHSLVHLLAGPGANLAAVSMQCPAGTLPGSSSNSSTGVLSLHSSSSSSLSPGVQLTAEHCLAESITMRGARMSPAGALCTTAAAQAALNTLLTQRQQQAAGHHCVVHSCISPMPLPAPLSFPRSLLPCPLTSSTSSSTPQHTTAAGHAGITAPSPLLPRSAKSPSVPAPAALSRLTASSGFEAVLQGAAQDLQRYCASSAGRSCLEEWGYSMGDVAELGESLLSMAGQYSAAYD